jgi:tetratricopeptide (TPR) repeat protein
LSRFYTKQGKPVQALEILEEGYRRYPGSATLLTALIQTYVQQKKYDNAIEICEKRIQDNPRDMVAYNLLGWLYADMKNYQKAESALQKAIELQPLWPAPHNNLAKVYLAQGRKEEAIEKYEAAIRNNPKNGSTYLALALLYEGDRDFSNAIKVYEQALKENPNFWFAANNLAFLLSEQSEERADLERALKLAHSSLKIRRSDPAVLDTIGWIYYRMGDYNQAQGYIERAVAGAPDSPILNYHLGMVLYKNDKPFEAQEKLEKALEGDADFYGRDLAEKTLKELS